MKIFFTLSVVLLTLSCDSSHQQKSYNLDIIADEFVIICHSVSRFDSDFVDAYYGPDSLKKIGIKDTSSLQNLKVKTNYLKSICDTLKIDENNQIIKLRKKFLIAQLNAANSRINHLLGFSEKFDEESQNIYLAKSPDLDNSHYANLINQLDKYLPGKGDIYTRYIDYKSQFEIPKDKIDTVFKRAIEESRAVTKKYFNFNANENFKLEYVENKAWSGYNWFQGNNQSIIQINISHPIYIERAIDLAAHEGYPGHHTFHSNFENIYVRDSGWVEFSIYPLFSPISLISEGSANFGIEVAFPGETKLKFEKEVLYPLAGINPALAENYNQIEEIVGKLSYAGNMLAKKLLDGEINEQEATKLLQEFNLMTESRAKQRVEFIKKYRTYVINYNLGKDLVEKFVIANGGNAENPEKRWMIFMDLLSHPYLADDLMILGK